MTDLEQRVALVTGGTSLLGRAIAINLAERAGRVAIQYHKNRAEAIKVVKEIERKGGEGQAFQVDLTAAEERKGLFNQLEKTWGRVDILVNNFGPFFTKKWDETTAAEWLSVYQANVVVALEMMKAVLPGMRARKWGRIINLGFHRAGQMVAFAGILPYAVSKTALLLLTRTAASTEVQNGITVNMVSPGLIEGGWLPSSLSFEESSKQMAKPDEVGKAVSFLASDEASAITGVNLVVAGTWKM